MVGIKGDEVYMVGTPEEVLKVDILEGMYAMKSGDGEILARGIWQYANSLKEIICQK